MASSIGRCHDAKSEMSNAPLRLAPLAILLMLSGCGERHTVARHTTMPRLRAATHNKISIAAATANARPGIVPGYLTEHILIGAVPGLGVVLTNGYGRTLYAFERDERQAVTCMGACAKVWRPFTVTRRQGLDSSPSLSTSLIGAMRGSHGESVITFAGWPLYAYSGDTQAGTANGQGLYSYGGHWYAISKEGALVTKTR